MEREAVNPNTTGKPVEITRAEVARLAKTGCALCHGGGCISFAAKSERDQLVANARWFLCRCVAHKFVGRLDVQEIGGKMHWMPRAGAVTAPAPPADVVMEPVAPPSNAKCAFVDADGYRCALSWHPPEFRHCDALGTRRAHPSMVSEVSAP